uniref:Odorant-binding protein 1 n=1 Tax=Pyrrhalta aenescens TaxID=281545 RepID=A0A1J0KKX9_9CUCU|nr:odorant-binding protein 1 [Pyrrhalta aenescens]
MKTVFVFLCVLVAALAHGLPNLPENERIKLAQVHRSCQSNPKTFCDENKLRNLSNYINDIEVGTHMLCMAVKAGLMTPNGDFDIPSIKRKVALVTRDHSNVDGLVQKCTRKAEKPGKTANLMWMCFFQNDIQYYHQL